MNYRTSPQGTFNFAELIVDNFAGGGGASTGIEKAVGRTVDIAINHDPDAIAMHTVNHPTTHHYCESVWDINPLHVTAGRPVGLAWFSPDCKHFSKAKGATPVNKEIRGLAWVAMRWAATVRPRIIMLENVEEFKTWGPVVEGRPCPSRKGKTFKSFVRQLEQHGYTVEWRNLVASDYGAPTIRKRFFLIARCDGEAIVWPAPTHGNPAKLDFKKNGLKKWKTAADIIDWALPCPSIFERNKPLAENTLRRIARGIERYVIDNPKPFIVRIGQHGFGADRMQYDCGQPLTTVTTKAEHCLVMPSITKYYGAKAKSESRGGVLYDPLATQTTENRFGLVTAFLTKFRTGATGSSLDEPLHTVTAGSFVKRPGGAAHAMGLITSHLIKMKKGQDAQPIDEPLPTLTMRDHVGEVRAFFIKYYSTGGQWGELDKPLSTVTAQDRVGLVTVHGEQYQIVDIGLRMLEPHELFTAQGFPKDYIIDRDAKGRSIPKYKQVARCGNAVCPQLAEALVRANYSPQIDQKAVAAA